MLPGGASGELPDGPTGPTEDRTKANSGSRNNGGIQAPKRNRATPRLDYPLAGEAARLFVVLVFFGDVVFGNFAGLHFGLVGIGRAFHGVNDFRLEILALGGEFLDALGIGGRGVAQILDVSGLPASGGTETGASWDGDFADVSSDARAGAGWPSSGAPGRFSCCTGSRCGGTPAARGFSRRNSLRRSGLALRCRFLLRFGG